MAGHPVERVELTDRWPRIADYNRPALMPWRWGREAGGPESSSKLPACLFDGLPGAGQTEAGGNFRRGRLRLTQRRWRVWRMGRTGDGPAALAKK
jgi:hypothetical protein